MLECLYLGHTQLKLLYILNDTKVNKYQFGEKKRRESDSAEQNSGRSTWPEKELINRLTKRERERERIRESVGTWCGKEKGNWKNRRRSQGRRRRARGERERGHGRGERKGENRGVCR